MQFVVFNSHVEVVTETGSAAIPFGWWVRPGQTAAEYVAGAFVDMFHPSELMPEEDRDTMGLCREAVLELMHEDDCERVAGAVFGSLSDEPETDEQYAATVAVEVARVGVVHNMMEVA
jgi:hypothetical protein